MSHGSHSGVSEENRPFVVAHHGSAVPNHSGARISCSKEGKELVEQACLDCLLEQVTSVLTRPTQSEFLIWPCWTS